MFSAQATRYSKVAAAVKESASNEFSKAKTLKSSRQGGTSGEVVPAAVRTIEVLPDMPTTSGNTWNGAVPVSAHTFTLPKDALKIVDAVLEFNFTIDSSAASTVRLVGSPWFIDRYEVVIGDKILETVLGDEAFHNVLLQSTDQDFRVIAPALNLANDATALAAATYVDETTGTSNSGAGQQLATRYLPLWSAFVGMQPFLAGIQDPVRIRVWPAAGITITSTNATITNPNWRLLLVEQKLSDGAVAAEIARHNAGIRYSSYFLRKWQSQAQGSLSGSTTTSFQLASFSNPTAALITYVSPSTFANSTAGSRTKLSTVQLLDAGGNSIVPALKTTWLEAFVQPYVLNSSAGMLTNCDAYVVPFASNLDPVFETGTFSGAIGLTGKEQIRVQPKATASNVIVNVVAVEYVSAFFRNGKCESIDYRPY